MTPVDVIVQNPLIILLAFAGALVATAAFFLVVPKYRQAVQQLFKSPHPGQPHPKYLFVLAGTTLALFIGFFYAGLVCTQQLDLGIRVSTVGGIAMISTVTLLLLVSRAFKIQL